MFRLMSDFSAKSIQIASGPKSKTKWNPGFFEREVEYAEKGAK